MREHWTEFARSDPMFYIATRPEPWTTEEFFASGREVVEDVLAWAGEGVRRERMLEIGCGMGRMLAHFASHFERVDGVDIAPEMVERARASDLPDNVHVSLTTGNDLGGFGDSEIDFVFSFVVFQHIPDPAIISSYLREVARVLRADGRAALQFDTRPKTIASRLAFRLPDFMLPRTRRRYIRRYRLDSDQPREMARNAGLELVKERGAGTGAHFLALKPA
jgi:SAM-dependent methyltransferase